MALRYKVLERFSEEARREVAGRVFDHPIVSKGNLYPHRYACADGLCVLAALFAAEGKPTRDTHPEPMTVCRKIGTTKVDAWNDVTSIVYLNDTGHLATPEAVRALLLGDTTPTGAAAAGVAS